MSARAVLLAFFDGRVLGTAFVDNGVSREFLAGLGYARLAVTGYGRHPVAGTFGGEVISEISTFATRRATSARTTTR